jgi:predicted nuclease of predicted toxin-antitoxin system
MRFLVDAQLPPALARWLEEHGQTAEHVIDLGMADADDWAVWARAQMFAAVILTKDEDFAIRRALAAEGPSVVWIRRGNTRRRELLTWFALQLPRVLDAPARGESLIEVA